MELTVAIPSRGRNAALTRLLDALGRQTIDPARFEVIVGLDGSPCPAPHPGATFLKLDYRGPAATRNAIVACAQGETILFLNDDVVPEPRLLEAHLCAHRELGACDLVLGAAPWAIGHDDTLFDRLIRETSLVFFYNAMNTHERERDWGYRHAWTLNLSLRAELARRCPFDERLRRAMFEDLEWAYRLAKGSGSRVFYRPEALVLHDHRYTPGGYLERERALGAQALALAEVNPGCAQDIFKRDIRETAFVRECVRLCEQEAGACRALERQFADLANHAPDGATDMAALHSRFLPLKRHAWRQGFIAAACEAGLASTSAA